MNTDFDALGNVICERQAAMREEARLSYLLRGRRHERADCLRGAAERSGLARKLGLAAALAALVAVTIAQAAGGAPAVWPF